MDGNATLTPLSEDKPIGTRPYRAIFPAAILASLTMCAAHLANSFDQQDPLCVPICMAEANRCCKSGLLAIPSFKDENRTSYVTLALLPTISTSRTLVIVTTSARPLLMAVNRNSGDRLNAISTATTNFWERESSPMCQNSVDTGVVPPDAEQHDANRVKQIGRQAFANTTNGESGTLHITSHYSTLRGCCQAGNRRGFR